MNVADALWMKVVEQIRTELGWSLGPPRRLGRRRENRRVWLAEAAPGTVVIKLLPAAFRAERASWSTTALALLAKRGSPVPRTLWQGQLDERWWLVVQTSLPGEQLQTLDAHALDQLLALVDLQAKPHLPQGGWNVSWWVSVVVFDGWERWWQDAWASAPETARRLHAFLEPAQDHWLPVTDLVHGDLNISNVLSSHGAITGIVDWDDMGVGSRALDLTSLLFDSHRLAVARGTACEVGGDERLLRRVVQIAGWKGLRCTVTYGAIARLALAARRGEPEDVQTWSQATDALLDSISRTV